MPKLSIQDLQAVAEKARRETRLRDGTGRAKITVHMGTCGIASGARAVMTAVMDELAKHELDDVMVASSACAGLCSREPMMTVELRDGAPVKYGDVTPERVAAIVEQHILGGRLIERWALVRNPVLES
jgi:NADP-reducing hydrogenase subunit HndB